MKASFTKEAIAMGRRKLVMKRIENNAKRLVTFSKRRTGLIKKANDLSVLCDVDIALVVFSSSGKFYQFSSSPDSLINLIKHHQNKSDEAEGSEAAKHKESFEQENDAEPERPLRDLLKIIQRQVGQPEIEMMAINDLVQLETQLHSALNKARSQQAQLKLNSITFLHQQEKDLKEEGQQLNKELAELVAGYDHSKEFLRDLNLPIDGNHEGPISLRMF